MPSEWGCWTCGSDESRVTSTARDEEGNKIRRRKCVACGAIWISEERRLAKGTRYAQRAFTAAEAQRQRRMRSRHCRYCGGRYRGRWTSHLAGPTHQGWKAARVEEIRVQRTNDSRWRYHADPVYREHQIASATQRAKERRHATHNSK